MATGAAVEASKHSGNKTTRGLNRFNRQDIAPSGRLCQRETVHENSFAPLRFELLVIVLGASANAGVADPAETLEQFEQSTQDVL